ncbi:LuxR C-terminal-related transcriptional regulator [Sphingobium sp. JS3065]|uniref:LuxR C-terminal-related transcriptional regulator n=1 Tax=Sphingobium sp. JS3065 TaxID=2970925 RepID=UPI002265143F|nr:LuxR C-terminal-related transcriptional regulator [Sphingobium sp. JS3065]UZW53917.1 LuxR C-terminal-related transcriptional regulator [Sphingobium sp. JS3065]
MLKTLARATKPMSFTVPLSTPHDPAGGFVPTRAFARLQQGKASVTLLSAPPGYGKTTLLRAYARSIEHAGGCVDWCQLDRIVAGGQPGENADIIFIDDAQDADPGKFARLIRTITSNDAAQRYVIATRTLPDMDWIGLMAKGRIEILDVEILALNDDEVGAILELYAGCRPTADQAGKVARWIEGWPIGAQCYGMLARRRGGWANIDIREVYPREDLGHYLNESIYSELDDAMRRFLLDLADLGRFSPAMLREVIDPSAELLLQRARLENVMIVPAAGGGEWLRLHGIFQQFLEAKKRQAGAAKSIDLLRAASSWCERREAFCDAIDYAFGAGDCQRAQALIVAHAAHIAHGLGELPKMLVWTEQLEELGQSISIPLRLWKIWALVLALQVDQARAELEILDRQMPDDAPSLWLAHRDRLRVSLAARGDNVPALIELADSWMGRWEDLDAFHTAAVCVLRAFAHHRLGDRHAARRDLMIARQRAGEAGGLYGQLWVAKAEAYLEFQSGRVTRAREIILSAIARAHESDEMAASTIGTVHLLAARILVETGEAARAREHLAAGHLHVGDNGLIETHIAALEAATLLAEDSDGVDAALCETHHRLVRGLRYGVSADLLAVALQLRNGRAADASDDFRAAFSRDEAGGWLHCATGLDIPGYMTPDIEQAYAWVALGEGKIAEAAAIASKLLVPAELAGHARDHISLLMLSTTCSAKLGRMGDAKRNFERAIRMASDRGFCRTIVDHGWGLTTLLAETELASAIAATGAPLLAALRMRYGIAVDGSDAQILVDRLTAREHEVLVLLDTGLTSQKIADHLDLGLSTTKWHIQNIYNKLDVRNRSGALARARRLALL